MSTLAVFPVIIQLLIIIYIIPTHPHTYAYQQSQKFKEEIYMIIFPNNWGIPATTLPHAHAAGEDFILYLALDLYQLEGYSIPFLMQQTRDSEMINASNFFTWRQTLHLIIISLERRDVSLH